MSTLTARRADRPSPGDETPADIEPFRWYCGTYFVGLFPVALFDQAMHPAVSAALAETGRIRNDPIGRGLRSAASEQLMQWGDEETREAEAQRLRDLHRVIKGTAPDGIRYSARDVEPDPAQHDPDVSQRLHRGHGANFVAGREAGCL